MTAIEDERPWSRSDQLRLAVQCLAVPPFLALLLFLPAGTLAWERGWIFCLVFLATCLVVGLIVWRVNPEIVAARSRPHAGTKRWDKILALFLAPSLIAILPVAALDDGRFHWSHAAGWVCGLGYVLFLAGMAIVSWAEAVNKFFEPTVRIQTDRGHKVIDTGPYGIIRHPGYVGATLLFAGIALALGSYWALIPAGLSSLLLIVRTRWEDRTLQAELPGYAEFAQRVRYKWIPGIW